MRELISAITLGAHYTDSGNAPHIYPTLAEGLTSTLGELHYEEGI
jgi:hypothetical protein